MSLTFPDPIDRSRFPIDVWGLTETRYDTDNLGQRETVFAVGNGFLGLRGNYEEGDAERAVCREGQGGGVGFGACSIHRRPP